MQRDDRQFLDVNITSATILRLVFWAIFFWLLFLIRKLALVVLVAVVIASAVEPAVRQLRRWRVPRTLAVLLVYLLVFSLLFSLLPFFLVPVFGDLLAISSTLPAKLGSLPFLSDTQSFLSNFSWLDYLSSFSSSLQDTFSGVSHGFLQTLMVIFGGFFNFILVVVVSFYLAVQEDGIANFLRLIAPARHEKYVINLWHRSERKIGLWMQGQLLLGVMVGVLTYLGLTVLGVKHALVLALMAAIFELIPIFGPIIAAVPAVLLSLIDSATLALVVAGFYVIVQQFESQLLHPLVVRKIVGVPPIIAILSLVVGYQLAGFIGILLAVPLTTFAIELLDDFEQSKRLVTKQEDPIS